VLTVLRRRDFSLLWWAGLVSVAGDWMLRIALPYVVYTETGSTLATAGMVVAELVPAVLLTSFAGVLVDRWDRARVMVVTALGQSVVVVSLLLVDESRWWVVFVVAAAQSSLAAFTGPAESALLPDLVPHELLVQANALNTLNNRLGRLVGAPLGAAVLAWGGLAGVVLVDAATFLVAAVLVLPVRDPGRQAAPQAAPQTSLPRAESAPARFWREWLDGLRVVRDDQAVLVLFAVFCLMTFGGTMLDPLHVPWVRDVLGRGAGVVAVLAVVGSVTGVVGSVLVGVVGDRWSARSLAGWGSTLAGVLLHVRVHVPSLVVAVVCTALGGVLAVASSVGVETLAQQRTQAHLRGRVLGSLQASIWLASLLGAVLGGIVGEVVGLVPALDLAAALVLVSGVVALTAVRAVGQLGAVAAAPADTAGTAP
jgi:predicted MFS family arabinose efflux permease